MLCALYSLFVESSLKSFSVVLKGVIIVSTIILTTYFSTSEHFPTSEPFSMNITNPTSPVTLTLTSRINRVVRSKTTYTRVKTDPV